VPDERVTVDLAGSRGCGGVAGGDQRVDHFLTGPSSRPATIATRARSRAGATASPGGAGPAGSARRPDERVEK
jgi:hypothetical protein